MQNLKVCRSFLPAALDLTDRRFGSLVAQRVVGKAPTNSLLWYCNCDCGGTRAVKSSTLVCGKAISCLNCANPRSTAQLARFQRQPSWNKGATYQTKSDDEVYLSKKAWTDAAIRKYGNTCQRCGWSEARCDTHHKVERRHGGQNTMENAEVLCPNCHRIHHQNGVGQ